jgi:inner membrane protease ATP23
LKYDHIRSKNFDPGNCKHLACSEIRAANLSGYCNDEYSYMHTLVKSGWNSRKMNNCVKSKANEHMIVYYEHCNEKSINYVNEVWDKCYLDKSPIKDFSREKSYI